MNISHFHTFRLVLGTDLSCCKRAVALIVAPFPGLLLTTPEMELHFPIALSLKAYVTSTSSKDLFGLLLLCWKELTLVRLLCREEKNEKIKK